MNQRPSTAQSVGLSVAATGVRQSIQFLIAVALARLLPPHAFGAVASLYIFVGIGTALAELGLGAALIHKSSTSIEEESSAFYFNVAAGALIALALAALGPVFEDFYAYPGLASVTAAMAVTVFIGSLGSVHLALIIRDQQLGLNLWAGLVSGLVSGVVAVWLALSGWGIWSLVWQALVASAVNVLVLWVAHPWRPKGWPKVSAVRPLLAFGGALTVAGLLEAAFGRLHLLVIGRLYGATELGFYTRAVSTQQLPPMMLGATMHQVAFPLMAAHAGKPEALRMWLRSALRTSSFLLVPAMLGIAASARWLVPFLFGEQWRPSVPILQVLCIGGAFLPLHQANLTLLKALGRSGLFLRLEVAKKSVLVVLLLIAAPYGLLAIAWSQVVASIASAWLNGRYAHELAGYGLRSQLGDFLPYALVAVCMAVFVQILGRVGGLNDAWTVLTVVPLGACFYAGGCLLFGLVDRAMLRRLLARQGLEAPPTR